MTSNFKIKTFVIATLRRASYRFPARTKCRQNASIGRNQYLCNYCKGVFTRKETKVDHIDPVVDPAVGWVSYEVFIERLFCDLSGLQILCSNCHKTKTKLENQIRKENKKK